jgi:aminomethyltransferase
MENPSSPLKKTSLWAWHQAHGAKLVPFAGYEMPIQYEGVIPEHKSVRENCGLFDVSHMGVARISGSQATAFLDAYFTRDLSKLSPGKAAYGFFCRENGGTVDDLIVYKSSVNEYYLVLNASNKEKDLAYLCAAKDSNSVRIEALFDDLSLFALQGPKALLLLSELNVDTNSHKAFSFFDTEIFGVSVKIAMTGYTGEKGCEIFVANEDAPKIWEGLLQIGQKYAIKPIGLAARDTLRTEMGYSLYGHELSEEISPVESDLLWAINFKKSIPFLGQAALTTQKDKPKRKLVALMNPSRQAPRPNMSVEDASGKTVGLITSGTYAPSLDYSIGLALVDQNSQAPYSVRIRPDKLVEFKITTRPFLKPTLKTITE